MFYDRPPGRFRPTNLEERHKVSFECRVVYKPEYKIFTKIVQKVGMRLTVHREEK